MTQEEIQDEKNSLKTTLYSVIRSTKQARSLPADVPATWTDNPFMDGQYRRVSRKECPGLLVEFRVPEGAAMKLHYHEFNEVMQMIQGRARFTIEGSRQVLTDGYVLSVPARKLHEAYFITESHFLVLWTEVEDARS